MQIITLYIPCLQIDFLTTGGFLYMNEITINTANRTPIEIALGIDEEGMTTARKLYAFLELDSSNYSR